MEITRFQALFCLLCTKERPSMSSVGFHGLSYKVYTLSQQQ